jgi:GNAT superfamily N-acetyltransferase
MATVLTPMARERFADWIISSQRDYAASLVSTGETPTQAVAHAQRSSGESFPGDVPLPNHHVFDSAEHRGEGLGRAAMALAEEAVKGFGGSSIGLNVFRYNTAALHLYESVGYETRSQRMFKAL